MSKPYLPVDARRTEKVMVRFTRGQRKELARLAKAQKVTLSTYVYQKAIQLP